MFTIGFSPLKCNTNVKHFTMKMPCKYTCINHGIFDRVTTNKIMKFLNAMRMIALLTGCHFLFTLILRRMSLHVQLYYTSLLKTESCRNVQYRKKKEAMKIQSGKTKHVQTTALLQKYERFKRSNHGSNSILK